MPIVQAAIIVATCVVSLGAIVRAAMAFDRKAAVPAILWTLASPSAYVGGLIVLSATIGA